MTAADVESTEVLASTAPPARSDRRGSVRPGASGSPSETRTEVLAPLRIPRLPRSLGGDGRPPRAPRPRRSRLPAPGPRPRALRDGRWWAGVAVLTASVLLLTFVAHAAVFSALQHYRAQTIAYEDLREALATATAPVNQITIAEGEEPEDGRMNPVGVPVALLEAPSIGLSEVVREGTAGDVLRGGVGHRRDTVMPGQQGTSTILGRQTTYGGPFAQLYRLQPGDGITVTTGQGTHTYRVLGLRRAGDPEPPALERGDGRLELQTADGLALFPSGVLSVDAELTSEAQQTPSRVMGYAALPEDERAMGTDSGAWFVAFFFFVFFAAAAGGVVWLWRSWGRWQAWLVGVPVVAALGVATADVVMSALPNLL
jgi:sortase A